MKFRMSFHVINCLAGQDGACVKQSFQNAQREGHLNFASPATTSGGPLGYARKLQNKLSLLIVSSKKDWIR